MYVGHLGIALLGKGLRRELPLWLLLVAAFSPDLFEALRSLTLGGTPDRMWAHSLPGALALAAALGTIYFAARRDLRGAALLSAATLSHPLADFVANQIPLWPGGPYVGLDLFHVSQAAIFTLEIALALAGWLLYRRTLPERRRLSWAAWAVAATLVAFEVVYVLWY